MYKIFALALVGVLAVPAAASAAMYAYVNTAGDVSSVEAVSASAAIATAPGIHMRSGVLLLDSAEDEDVLDEDVSI